jgi:hypothetical protein
VEAVTAQARQRFLVNMSDDDLMASLDAMLDDGGGLSAPVSTSMDLDLDDFDLDLGDMDLGSPTTPASANVTVDLDLGDIDLGSPLEPEKEGGWVKEAEEKAAKDAEEKAAKDAEEKAAKDAEEKKAAKEAEEKKAAKEAEEKAAKEAEEKKAAKEAEEKKAAKDAEEKAVKDAEEKAAKEAEEKKAAKEAEENANKRAAEEKAENEVEEKRQKEAAVQAAKEGQAEAQAKKEAEEKATKEASAGRVASMAHKFKGSSTVETKDAALAKTLKQREDEMTQMQATKQLQAQVKSGGATKLDEASAAGMEAKTRRASLIAESRPNDVAVQEAAKLKATPALAVVTPAKGTVNKMARSISNADTQELDAAVAADEPQTEKMVAEAQIPNKPSLFDGLPAVVADQPPVVASQPRPEQTLFGGPAAAPKPTLFDQSAASVPAPKSTLSNQAPPQQTTLFASNMPGAVPQPTALRPEQTLFGGPAATPAVPAAPVKGQDTLNFRKYVPSHWEDAKDNPFRPFVNTFYQKHNPERAGSEAISQLLYQWQGREGALCAALHRKYQVSPTAEAPPDLAQRQGAPLPSDASLMISPFSIALANFYKAYDVDRVVEVPALLHVWTGHEAALMAGLYDKYQVIEAKIE